MRTLLLDSTFYPVRIINWQKAMILLLTGRAEMVDMYEDHTIQSVSQSYQLPRILRLFKKHKNNQNVRFTRQNVFWRDEFCCQYCGGRFNGKDLTFDHVIPSSRGGKTTWENIVSACNPCNTRKGSKTPQEARMPLIKQPKRPDWTPQLCLRIKEGDPAQWWNWVGIKKKPA